MSIALDGFKVLKRMGETPEAFRAARVEADKAARTLVVKCLKAKATGLDAVREMRAALRSQFELIVDAMTDAEIKSIVTRLDKHQPELKTMAADARRRHFLILARGEIDSARPAAKAKKRIPTKSTKKDAPKRLQSGIADYIRSRGETDED